MKLVSIIVHKFLSYIKWKYCEKDLKKAVAMDTKIP